MYTQKGTQRIEVVVRGEGVGGESSGEMESLLGKNGGGGERGRQQWATRRKDRILKLNALHSAIFMVQSAKRLMNYSIGGIGYKYGDQAYQDQVSRKFEVVGDFGGVLMGGISGAMYGSFGGPIGIVFGVTMGLAQATSNVLFKYAEREREFAIKVFKQENAVEYKKARAGTNLTFGRLR